MPQSPISERAWESGYATRLLFGSGDVLQLQPAFSAGEPSNHRPLLRPRTRQASPFPAACVPEKRLQVLKNA